MVKNSFILVISQKKRKITQDRLNFKYLNLPLEYEDLLQILNCIEKDYVSQRGLSKILGKRQRLLSYLLKKDRIRYKKLINQFDIRVTNSLN